VSNDWLEVYEWFGIEAVSPNKVAEQIEAANGDRIEVYINSPGGDVYAGSEIYTQLKEYQGDSVGKIVGVAASAASIASMGVKVLKIAPTAQIMMHNASGRARGDHRTLAHESGVLKGWDVSIANAYILKTGMEQQELLDLMSTETWLTAQEAKEKGFVDEIMFDDDNTLKLTASASQSLMLPEEVLNKVKNELMAMKRIAQNNDPPPVNENHIEPPEQTRTNQVPRSLLSKKLNLIGRVH